MSKELDQYIKDKNYGIIKGKEGFQLLYNGRVNHRLFKTKLLAAIYLSTIK